MKLFQKLKQHSLTPNQYYLLYCKKNNERIELLKGEDITKELTQLTLLEYLNSDNSLTQKGDEVVLSCEEVYRKNSVKNSVSNLGTDYLKEIKSYRKKFPIGKRATETEVLQKMSELFQTDNTITWDEIYKAVDLYFSEPRDDMFVMKAGNFIKVNRGAGSTSYTLSEYIERIREGEEGNTNSSSMYDYVID